MVYFVYMILTKHKTKNISYVGYTSNLINRLKLHNNSRGAKFTRGKKWKIIYKRYFKTRNEAMSYEYKLKNDKKKRRNLLKYENFNIIAI